ncbi:MAG: toprim domain-containing protein [Pacificimonas sp.]
MRHDPAIVAAVRADEGVNAVQRIFLDGDSGGPAAFSPHRRSLGPLGIGAVRLTWPDDAELGLAEGVEDAIAVTQLTGIPCWALLGNLRFGTVAIPESVTDLHLFVDNDAGGDTAWELGSAHFAREGRRIVKRQPRMHGYDWDDVHRKWRERQPA